MKTLWHLIWPQHLLANSRLEALKTILAKSREAAA